MSGTLHVPSFGGGVVRLGSPNVQRTDELLEADSLDIGPRGQLVCASDVTDYLELKDLFGARSAWSEVHGLDTINFGGVAYGVTSGIGANAIGIPSYLIAYFLRRGSATPVPAGQVYQVLPYFVGSSGALTTVVQFPGVFNGTQVALINLGAREGFFASAGPGLYVLTYTVATGVITLSAITAFDSLGSAGSGFVQQLHFRGIVGYNDHVFGYGYDSDDATNLDGPNRVMFSNLGEPLKWGNDNQATVGARAFTDSDAIVIGDAGEIVRGAIKWAGKLWFGTNRELHYIGGFGRDSFVTDGANQVARAFNIVGPRAMIEGPDKLLYGVADQGLWAFDGNTFQPHFKRLQDYAGHSTGWWDLIWTDPTLPIGYPGRTNQDLVWMAIDWDREQVLVGIPFCNAAAGAGAGADTVVIKFHTRSGGFTRQLFLGVAYSAAGYFRREAQEREVRFLLTATAGQVAVKKYAYQATPTTSPAMPTRLPLVAFGPYAPFGPDGEGILRRLYLTIAWESAASLPLAFTITTKADEGATDVNTLTIGPAAPVGPVAGDLWLDTSQTDANLGNATVGTTVRALGGFLTRTWRGSRWSLVPGSGELGTRATIPIPITRRTATRVTVFAQCTAAAGRFEIEDFGLNPGSGTGAA